MNLIFFDEVKPQQDYHYFHLGGVCVSEENLKIIEDEINQVAQEVFDDIRLERKFEFHAKDIYHGKNAFKNILDKDSRVEILCKLLLILQRPQINLIDIRINTKGLYNPDYASKIAFMFLCERANSLLINKQALGMLIGDRESDSNAERFSVALSQYRVAGTEFEYGVEIKNLFESVHFTHSHLSRFLQLADIYSWYNQFLKRNRKSSERKHQLLLEKLKQKEINLYPSKYKYWPNQPPV